MTDYLRRSTFARWLVVFFTCAGAALWTTTASTQSPLSSALTVPADGSNWTGYTFQWTTVVGADCYYLYVGTTVGAKDVVNTGEVQVTSRTVTSLPLGVTLYARMWTKHGGVWRYRDSSFSVYPLTTTLTFPTAGQTGVALSGNFTWGTVPSVQAYYLYVGTSVGASNVVNTGEKSTTSYAYSGLQPEQTYYARMWTKIGGVWRYVDSTFTTAAVAAQLTYPVNGATGVTLPVTVQWSTVSGVQAYYLYIGTAVGLKDLANSGETTATSWATALPSSTTVYVRLWTKVSGSWRYVDSTFTTSSGVAPPLFATLTYPLNDAPNVSLPVNFQWTAVPNVQAYYLYVGTAPGLKDLVDSRETTQTSWMAGLPGASTVHARLWTRVGNVWRYTDTKFGTQAVAAMLSYPVSGLTVSTDVTFTWNAIAGAQGYTLDIGTSAGANDVLQVPEQTATSAPLTNLPQGQLLYARLGTRHGGIWRYSDSTFSTLITRAVLTTPVDAATGVTIPKVFQWTSVEDAQAYRLQVGSSTGSQNILDSGETMQTQWSVPLPDSSTLHARLWTKYDGVWRYVDSTFSTVALRARFIHPVIGAVGIDPGQPFEWTSASGADGYTLQIGTTFGSNDLLDTGEIQPTSYLPQALPADQTLYARIRTRSGSVWRFDDTIFTLENAVAPAQIIAPADGQVGFPIANQAFAWSSVPLATGYRLIIGDAPGDSNLYDSGEIFMTRRMARGLPTGTTLYAEVQTHLGNNWISSSSISFSAVSTALDSAAPTESVRWATGEIRAMANAENEAMPWSALGRALNPAQMDMAMSSDYANVLITGIWQVDGVLSIRPRIIAFTPGTTDMHTLVEYQRTDGGMWMLVDPTFGVTINKTSNGVSATAEEVSAATQAQAWGDMSYEFLTPAGDAYLTANYIDYPLLYLSIYSNTVPQPAPPSPLPYLLEESTPVSTPGIYIIGCEGQPTTSAIIDGQAVTVSCDGPDTTSSAFVAGSIAVPPGGSFRVFTLRRFVF